MKKLMFLVLTVSIFSFAFSDVVVSDFTTSDDVSVFLKYYNKDSKSYTFKVKTCGSTKKVKFKGSTSSGKAIARNLRS